MSQAAGVGTPPPPALVRGEAPFWKMADVKGVVVRRLITGYLVTNYRCFIWDVGSDAVRASVPSELTDVAVEGQGRGKRTKRGGTFLVPQTADYVPPSMGEPVETGDLVFRVKGEPFMVFREVAEPLKVKALIDALKAHARAHMRAPRGLGVDSLWKSPGETPGDRS